MTRYPLMFGGTSTLGPFEISSTGFQCQANRSPTILTRRAGLSFNLPTGSLKTLSRPSPLRHIRLLPQLSLRSRAPTRKVYNIANIKVPYKFWPAAAVARFLWSNWRKGGERGSSSEAERVSRDVVCVEALLCHVKRAALNRP